MKKFFSLLTLALLTLSAVAQTTVTLDFTSNDAWNLPTTNTVDAGTYSNGTYSITLAGSEGAGYRFVENDKYLILGKEGAYLTLPTFDYPVSKIEIVGRSNASGKVTQNIFVGEDAVSTETTGAKGTNTYEIAEANQAAGTVFTLRVTNANNTQITKINITVEDGSTPEPTVAAPVFTPNGGKFSGSQEVTITCADGPCNIYYSEGTELDWANYTYYNAPFYVTETKTFTAVAEKGGIMSEPTTVTFTKVDPAPAYTFLPANYDAVENKEFSIEKDGVTFECTKGTITGEQFRIFKGQTATFTAGEGIADIVKIEFTCTAEGDNQYGPGCFAKQSENGTYAYEGNIGTWTGKTNSVILTASKDQVRATQIVFTLDDGTTVYVADPILPEEREFDDEMTITITAEEGATINYALNDGDYTEYTVPFTINETTTVKAYAEYEGIRSNVVTATYTKKEATDAITTLKQANEQKDGTDFTFAGDAVVTAQQGAYLWLRDDSGYGLIYGKINGEETVTFNPGTVLNKNWAAQKTTYNGLLEYKNATNVSASENTNAELAAAQEITALSADLINAYVVVKNIKGFTIDEKNITATFEDGTNMVMYNQFNISDIPTEDGNYTVYGAVGRYAKGTTDQIQLYILNIEGYEPPAPQYVDVNNFAEAYALESGTKVKMLNDAVVTYQNGSRLFVRDTEGTSGLIYGSLGKTFENGQVLGDEWTATYQLFNGNTHEFEILNAEEIVASGETRNAAPVECTSISANIVNEYVILKGVTLQADTTANIFYTADNNIQICNFFNGVEIPEVKENSTYDVTGIVMLSKAGQVRVYVTEMTEVSSQTLVGDVDEDGNVNITDVTALIDMLLSDNTKPSGDVNGDGQINITDVTDLIDILLKN